MEPPVQMWGGGVAEDTAWVGGSGRWWVPEIFLPNLRAQSVSDCREQKYKGPWAEAQLPDLACCLLFSRP